MVSVERWSGVSDCALLPLARHGDARGVLVPIEGARDLPFYPKRLFTITDVPAGAGRGAHANLRSDQCIIAVAGGLSVRVYDGNSERTFVLDRPDMALYVPATVWNDLIDFAPGSVTLVLASDHYDGEAYIRDLDVFDDLRKGSAK